MRLSLVLGLIYFASEVLLTVTRRGRSKTGEKQDQEERRGWRIEDRGWLALRPGEDLDSERICEQAVAER
jgi:hypothetical protein